MTRHPMISVAEHKRQWRQKIRARDLGDTTPLNARIKSHALALLAGLPIQDKAIIGAYSPITGEVDCQPILAALPHAMPMGVTTALPVVMAKDAPLRYRAWSVGEPLVAGLFDIPVPGDTSPWVHPTILLIPMVGFDRQGYRLGMGGGFYDRTLALGQPLASALTIGLAFHGLEIKELPLEVHDRPLDWIVTEEGSMSCGTR
ncbi:MAG: 5-formyltetrahydrofolate cyclo-ligase [Pseudomonadota bacterium]